MKRWLAVSLALAIAACGRSTTGGDAQRVGVAVVPPSAQVPPGGGKQFAAAVTGSANVGVTWSVTEQGGGSVTSAGLYTAPAATGTFHVVATSSADPSASAQATVQVLAPVAVAISPAAPAVSSCQTVALTATVTGATNGAVTWSVAEAGGGTIDANGVYTAPSTAGTYHAVATSQAVPTASATVAIAVTDKILAVAVTPSTATVAPGGTATFTATVTTTCGTFAATALAAAP